MFFILSLGGYSMIDVQVIVAAHAPMWICWFGVSWAVVDSIGYGDLGVVFGGGVSVAWNRKRDPETGMDRMGLSWEYSESSRKRVVLKVKTSILTSEHWNRVPDKKKGVGVTWLKFVIRIKVRFAPQLHESVGGLPSLKLSLHSCSLPWSTNAMGIETSIALVLPAREYECDTSFVLRRPPALS
ncbi:hypothetical protein Tco_0213062 [Tanacetum coccineum]